MAEMLVTETLSKTRGEDIFRRLSRDIIRGRFEPGAKLQSDSLRSLYDVGISPLREALSRLVAVGLVTQEGQRGFRVADISCEDLIDLTNVRIWLESTALRLSIARGNSDWEAEILAAAHRLRAEPRYQQSEEGPNDDRWHHQHRLFHTALVKACGSPQILSYRERLYDLSDRYRRFSNIVAPGRDSQGEHDSLVSTIMRRDADLACEHIENHFLETAEIIMRHNLGIENARDRIDEARRLLRAGRTPIATDA